MLRHNSRVVKPETIHTAFEEVRAGWAFDGTILSTMRLLGSVASRQGREPPAQSRFRFLHSFRVAQDSGINLCLASPHSRNEASNEIASPLLLLSAEGVRPRKHPSPN
jgi:hypothetical protein